MSYCTVADVQALNPHRTYDTASKPTLAQISTLIDQIAGDIDMALLILGLTVPATTPTSLVTFLKSLNALGAAALADAGQFSATGDQESPHYSVLFKRYDKGLKLIETGAVLKLISSGGIGSYYTDVADQSTYPEPTFTIGKEF